MPDGNSRGTDVRPDLCSLTLKLDAARGVDRSELARLRSRFQGVLLERVDTHFAERVHTLSTNPYSQYLTTLGDNERAGSSARFTKLEWRVNTLDTDAKEHILSALLATRFDRFTVRASNLDLTVEGKDLVQISHKRLAERFYEPLCPNDVTVRFVTPTAFKQQGAYVILPEPRLMLQSLALKYSTLFDGDEPGADLIDELGNAARVVRYSIRTQQFHVDRVRVPGFVGTVSFRVTGAPTLKSYVAMLLLFGEFSGCGIKTSMGMGGMRLLTDIAPGRVQ